MNVTTITKGQEATFRMTGAAADVIIAAMIKKCVTALVVTFNPAILTVMDQDTGDELRVPNDHSADFNALWEKVAAHCVAYDATDLENNQRHFLIEATNVPKDVTGDSIPDDERPSRVHEEWLATAVDSG
jgi:hypothetical protein